MENGIDTETNKKAEHAISENEATKLLLILYSHDVMAIAFPN